ncbi:MAG: hypothetical protein FWE34_01090 [Defluviitaleaceae bacterium]|nr:hypothetical protein [Defluviitaleaceae bacterium]
MVIKLELDKIHELALQQWVDEGLITEAQRAEAITKFKTSIFDDLIIDLEEVFAEIDF